MAKQPLVAVYLIQGEDELKRESVLRRLIKIFEELGDTDFNMDTLSATSSDVGTIIASCNTLPFASTHRLVIVHDAEKITGKDAKTLAAYIADPNPTTVLCLVAEKMAKNTIISKAVSKYFPKSIIDCAPKGKRDLPTLVKSMARVYGVGISPHAVDLLISYVGTSTVRIDTELKKLSSSLGADRRTIEESDVSRLVTPTESAKPWELRDAMASRDAARCESVLSSLKGQSPFGLLGMCTNRVRDLMTLKCLDARGEGAKASKALDVQDWQLRSLRQAANRFNGSELVDALARAAETDRLMKSGADPDLAFEMWLLSVCNH